MRRLAGVVFVVLWGFSAAVLAASQPHADPILGASLFQQAKQKIDRFVAGEEAPEWVDGTDRLTEVLGKRNGFLTELWAGTGAEEFDPLKVKNIPPYDTRLQDYNSTVIIRNPQEAAFVTYSVLPLLQEAADVHGNADAMVTLADIHTFGNFSMPTNYTKAMHYYEKAVNVSSNGHAYFMLGFMYSTGMFGEVPSNQAKAQLYYQLGMEAGDINALMALAYRSFKGIGCSRNCDLASVYYTKLARLGFRFLQENYNDYEPTEVSYNVKVPDFDGGIYGTEVSESRSTVVTSKKNVMLKLEQENDIDDFDRELNINFLSALDEYDGLYLREKNYTRAKQYLEKCVAYGTKLHGYKNPSSMSHNDRFRFSQCEALLGRMHLKGQGTPVDFGTAFNYLNDSTRFFNTSGALADLGTIYASGQLNNGVPQDKLAADLFMAATQLSKLTSKYLSKFLISKVPYGDIISSNAKGNIVNAMRDSVTAGDTEALYYYYDFIQSGYTKGVTGAHTCESSMLFPRLFIERLHRFFLPHLKYALLELDKYNYKNALLGYSIAAEQGVEAAQVSAGWLLYQSDSLKAKLNSKYKKHFDSKRLQSAISYFKRASDQGNIDSTIFLGDIYFYGVESANLSQDYEKAFSFYERAAENRSPHGSFNLGYMYEHGLGVVDGVDFFMAKARYDLASLYEAAMFGDAANQIPIYLSLLKLRIKHFLWGGKDKGKDPYSEKTSWFNAFKKIGMQEKAEAAQMEEEERRADQRARQQHGDVWDESDIEEDAELSSIGEFFALGVTFVMVALGLRNTFFPQFRQQGQPPPPQAQPQAPDADVQQPPDQGWQFNWNGVNFRRGNFEFHFMAL